jgi:hypothetical protein
MRFEPGDLLPLDSFGRGEASSRKISVSSRGVIVSAGMPKAVGDQRELRIRVTAVKGRYFIIVKFC